MANAAIEVFRNARKIGQDLFPVGLNSTLPPAPGMTFDRTQIVLLKNAVALNSDENGLIRAGAVVAPCSEAVVPTRIALIGGFTPRRCGIATFTADIYQSLRAASPDLAVDVYAMTPALDHTRFDPAVRAAIVEADPASYLAAAQAIEASGANLVWLQHEFGLFGGPAGAMILELLDRIAAPLMVTLHTVIPDPDAAQASVMQRLVARASRLVVMSERARMLLLSVYDADPDQIVLIPHGVPDRPFGRSEEFKAKFGLTGRRMLLTFGLLSPGKGIENVIKALPSIVAEHPDLLYCVVGATHPNVIAREGEAYRIGLQRLAAGLDVEHHIHWVDAFVETGDLLDLIEAADIYVTPYPGAAQSTSGTLPYAVALGKAVVSTPYVHALELLADDHGVLVPFSDSTALACEIGALLDDPQRLQDIQRRAYDRGRSMIWPAFAGKCLDLIADVHCPAGPCPAVDGLGLGGLLRICDDTGILQHSIYSVPDRAHGYCVDDNARALMLMNRLGEAAEPQRSQLAQVFAAFVQSAWNDETGGFRNFMGFDRAWLEERGSEDSCGRALWALGATARDGTSPGLRHWARGLFDHSAASAIQFRSPRATAFAMLGADYLLNTGPAHEQALMILSGGANRLLALFNRVSRTDWPWFETVLAYDNCRLPEAMIRAGTRLARDDLMLCGDRALRWIMDLQCNAAGQFRPIGSDSFGKQFEAPRPFDQQPVEVWAAIDACSAAFDMTGEAGWLKQAGRAYDWFGGANDRSVVVGDPATGSCHDGINPRGLNLNEGAESVLAYQLATCALRDLLAKSR
ncbi:MAG: glycosyltransferase family 4 protein [Novosphingobium sp.]